MHRVFIYIHALLIMTMTFMYLWQIIYKVKLQQSDINMTPSEICDRIFELVDQNHDGKNERFSQISSASRGITAGSEFI